MKVIFPNVRSEMAKKGLIYKDLKENGMGMSISSISYKMTGRCEFTLSEALKLKEILGSEMPVEELFRRNDTAH